MLGHGRTVQEAIDAATVDYEIVPDWVQTPDEIEEWATEREIVAAMLTGYAWRWGQATGEIIASETAFNLPIRNPETGGTTNVFRVGGKIDSIIRLADGRLAIRECKTCGEDIAPDSDYWGRLRVDQQISLYFMAAKEMGHDVVTVEYDVLRKPGIRPRDVPLLDDKGIKIVVDAEGNRVFKHNILKNGQPGKGHGEPMQSANAEKGWVVKTRRETMQEYQKRLLNDMGDFPDWYFARQEIPRLDADLSEFAFELWQYQQLIRDCQRNSRWPRNCNACLHPYRCEMIGLCWAGVIPSRNESAPAGYEFLSYVHPELAKGGNP